MRLASHEQAVAVVRPPRRPSATRIRSPGGAKPSRGERGERDGAARRPGPSCRARRGPRPRRRRGRPTTDRAPTPSGSATHRVGVREQARGDGPSPRRAVARRGCAGSGVLRDELARDAVPLEVVAQQLRGDCVSLPGGLTVSSAEQLLEERRHLVRGASRRPAFDCAGQLVAHVPELRVDDASGSSRPSTSTGVPCVPTTLSPITRATTR